MTTNRTNAGIALAGVPPASPAILERLHERVAAGADRDGLLDVAYRTVPSPVGDLLLAATRKGLVRVAFAREGHEAVIADLATVVGPRVLRSPRPLDDAARQLDEYFAGRRREFDLALDVRLAHGFRRRVLDRLRRVAFGERVTYAALAADTGNGAAVRATGSACAHNPLPLVIPCHRVVRRDGSIGDYLGGTAAKRAILAMEEARSAGGA